VYTELEIADNISRRASNQTAYEMSLKFCSLTFLAVLIRLLLLTAELTGYLMLVEKHVASPPRTMRYKIVPQVAFYDRPGPAPSKHKPDWKIKQ
jgi:hypothetical protein